MSRQRSRLVKRLLRKRLFLMGFVLVIAIVAVAILAPVLAHPRRGNPYQMLRDWKNPHVPPGSSGHLLGTGEMGTDIYYGLVWGARMSLKLGLTVVVGACAFGVALGLTSGYSNRLIDEVTMRIADVFLSIPSIVLGMAVAAALGPKIENIAYSLIIVYWPRYARLARNQTLSIAKSFYIEAARAVGMSRLRIMARHILPNILAPISVQATLDIGRVVLTIASLSFLGLSQSGITEWGLMVSEGQDAMVGGNWWAVTFPGIAIFLFVLAFNLMGDGLRDVMDPKVGK